MIHIKEYPPEQLPRYYKRLEEFLEISSAWRNLRVKAEAGSTRSEKGYQMLARSMAGDVAEAMGYDKCRAQVLSMAVGCVFPCWGKAGLTCIREYIRQKQLPIDPLLLCVETMEEYISTRLFVASDLDRALREYWLEIPGDPEVETVRVCQAAILGIKSAEKEGADGGALLREAGAALSAAAREAGRPVCWDQLPPPTETAMTEEEKQQLYAELDGFVAAFGEVGIGHYIITGEML